MNVLDWREASSRTTLRIVMDGYQAGTGVM
jgi:hypothetical protein